MKTTRWIALIAATLTAAQLHADTGFGPMTQDPKPPISTIDPARIETRIAFFIRVFNRDFGYRLSAEAGKALEMTLQGDPEAQVQPLAKNLYYGRILDKAADGYTMIAPFLTTGDTRALDDALEKSLETNFLVLELLEAVAHLHASKPEYRDFLHRYLEVWLEIPPKDNTNNAKAAILNDTYLTEAAALRLLGMNSKITFTQGLVHLLRLYSKHALHRDAVKAVLTRAFGAPLSEHELRTLNALNPRVIARALANDIATLETRDYNGIIETLIAHYARKPSDRDAIHTLFGSLTSRHIERDLEGKEKDFAPAVTRLIQELEHDLQMRGEQAWFDTTLDKMYHVALFVGLVNVGSGSIRGIKNIRANNRLWRTTQAAQFVGKSEAEIAALLANLRYPIRENFGLFFKSIGSNLIAPQWAKPARWKEFLKNLDEASAAGRAVPFSSRLKAMGINYGAPLITYSAAAAGLGSIEYYYYLRETRKMNPIEELQKAQFNIGLMDKISQKLPLTDAERDATQGIIPALAETAMNLRAFIEPLLVNADTETKTQFEKDPAHWIRELSIIRLQAESISDQARFFMDHAPEHEGGLTSIREDTGVVLGILDALEAMAQAAQLTESLKALEKK